MTNELNADHFKLIGEMTKEELIEQLVETWRRDLKAREIKDLRQMMAQVRIGEAKERIMKEAGLRYRSGILGEFIMEDDSE